MGNLQVSERNRQAHLESDILRLTSELFFLENDMWTISGKQGVETLCCQMLMVLLGEQGFGRVMRSVDRHRILYRPIDPAQIGRLLEVLPIF